MELALLPDEGFPFVGYVHLLDMRNRDYSECLCAERAGGVSWRRTCCSAKANNTFTSRTSQLLGRGRYVGPVIDKDW